MKPLFHLAAILAFAASGLIPAYSQTTFPEKITISREDTRRAQELVAKMTLEEKIAYIGGLRSFNIRAIERLGIPEIHMSDGPQGVRQKKASTLYPCGIMSAATWNRDLALDYGKALAADCKARGIHIILGPGVNINRSPLCGRNFEYFGEDPYLTSETAAAYILGVQSEGVMATIKHFAANNQEWDRHNISSDVDERTLQEIYFPAFRKAVQKAGVGAVMTSYNLLNGIHASESHWLNDEILRKSWGFDGMVMSDWTSTYSTLGTIRGGLDLEMPSGVFFNEKAVKALIESGAVSEKEIDTKVIHILQTLIAFGFLDKPILDESLPLDNSESAQTALEVAREGIVLLKNEGGALPLKTNTSVLVLGPEANIVPAGGGSGNVVPFHEVSPYAGLAEIGGSKVRLLSEDELFSDVLPLVSHDGEKGFLASYFGNLDLSGEPVLQCTEADPSHSWGYGSPDTRLKDDCFSVRWTGTYTPDRSGRMRVVAGGDDGYRFMVNGETVASHWGKHSYSTREEYFDVVAGKEYSLQFEFFEAGGEAKVNFALGIENTELLEKEVRRAGAVVYCAGFNSSTEGEGFDRPFALPSAQTAMIQRLTAINPKVVVSINAGAGVDFRGWSEKTPAILMCWYPGQEGGKALAEILYGKVSPCGKLPVTFDAAPEDNPTFNTYHRNPDKKYRGRSVDRVEYTEGIFMGYRGYDRSGKTPAYPFGYGLSYTTFKYSGISASVEESGRVKVEFTVTNTGKRDGKEVAQVYVSAPEASVLRPEKELRGFEKIMLRKGESRKVTICLDEEAVSFFDTDSGKFRVEPGRYIISIGGSSSDLPIHTEIRL